MTWWNHKTKPGEPEVIVSTGKLGEIIPCDAPKNVVVVPPKDPEPDLSTKPKDIVGYCFGYVCPKKHVGKTFESVTVDGYGERRACQECGGVGKPAVVKRIAEPQWGNTAHPDLLDPNPKPRWGWYNCYWKYLGWLLSKWANDEGMYWTRYEFVHYLDTPRRKKK